VIVCVIIEGIGFFLDASGGFDSTKYPHSYHAAECFSQHALHTSKCPHQTPRKHLSTNSEKIRLSSSTKIWTHPRNPRHYCPRELRSSTTPPPPRQHLLKGAEGRKRGERCGVIMILPRRDDPLHTAAPPL